MGRSHIFKFDTLLLCRWHPSLHGGQSSHSQSREKFLRIFVRNTRQECSHTLAMLFKKHRLPTQWCHSSLKGLQRQRVKDGIRAERCPFMGWRSLDVPPMSRGCSSCTNYLHGSAKRRDGRGVVGTEGHVLSASPMRGLPHKAPGWSFDSASADGVVHHSTFAASPMMRVDRYVSATLPLLDRGKSDGVGQVVPGPVFVKLSLGDSRDIPLQKVSIPHHLEDVADLLQYVRKECEETKDELLKVPATRLVLCSPTAEELEKNLRGVVTRDTVGLEDTFIDPTTPLSEIPDRVVVVDTEAEPCKSSLEFGMLTPLAELQPEPVLGPGIKIPFIAPVNWMSETLELIKQGYEKVDTRLDRVAPLALVRCSRGGKTRALVEVATALKREDYNVVSISLNDSTPVTDSDREDPVGALCLRMAFAAWKERSPEDISFDKFFDTFQVNPKTVTAWLGDTPCVLLIDEINNLPQSSVLSEFLKKNFVAKKGRYLVFSSHVIGATSELSSYMDTNSSRGVEIRRLPLVPSLNVARRNLTPDLTSREVLYYGLVPGLIHDDMLAERGYGGAKRNMAVQACKDQQLVDDQSVIKLLRSFVTGRADEVMGPLHAFMDSYYDHDRRQEILQWIPYHMMDILRLLSSSHGIRPDLQKVVTKIPQLFGSFSKNKTRSGDGWEALFIIALICRCVSGEFEKGILPLTEGPYPVTFNSPLKGAGSIDTKCLKEFVAAIQSPNKGPHVAIYCPRHAQFEGYDVIVAFYDRELTRRLYGYQLKEGKALPTKPASQAFEESYVIRGKPAGEDGMNKAWQTPGRDTIANFFGVSGSQWTPERWSELEASESGEESS